MAGKVLESYGCGDFTTPDPDRVRELENHVYRLLLEAGLHKRILKSYGIDHRIFHYFFKISPLFTEGKVRFMENLLHVLRDYYPGLKEIHEKMEAYICLLKELGKSSGSTSGKTH